MSAPVVQFIMSRVGWPQGICHRAHALLCSVMSGIEHRIYSLFETNGHDHATPDLWEQRSGENARPRRAVSLACVDVRSIMLANFMTMAACFTLQLRRPAHRHVVGRAIARAAPIHCRSIDDDLGEIVNLGDKLSTAAQLSITPPSDEDLATIERQLGHPVDNIAGVGLRCKHGHPQAFAFDPTGRNAWRGSGQRRSKLESGMFRLSCPLLVRAIDEWESEGAVVRVNDEVGASAELQAAEEAGDKDTARVAARRLSAFRRETLAAAQVALAEHAGDDPPLAEQLKEAHKGHAAARHVLLGDRIGPLLEDAADAGEEQLAIITHILGSGIAGQTRSKPDIKCVHAQLADGLCRSNSNGVARELTRRLEARGAEVCGSAVCCAQCDAKVPEEQARETWWYESVKNRVRLPPLLCPARGCDAGGRLPLVSLCCVVSRLR